MASFARPFLLIFALGLALQFVGPWWIIAPVALLGGAALGRTGGRAFLAGFAGIGLGWLLLAAWQNHLNDGRLARRVAELLPLGGSAAALVLLTAVIGGLVGGLAALAGCWLRQAVAPAKTTAADQSATANL